MLERPEERINAITAELSECPVAQEFFERVKEGLLARDENPYTHLCVYFAGYDKEIKKVFITR